MPRHERDGETLITIPPPANDDAPLPGVSQGIGATLVAVLVAVAALVALMVTLSR